MPEVSGYIRTFRSINKRWDGAITAGMIETGRMDSDAGRLFGPLIQDMGSTRSKYSEIQRRLVDAILYEMAKKVVLEITDAAKFTINILKRNLYERTADVGYLATDAEIVSFLRRVRDASDDDADGEAAACSETLRRRLEDYRHEYTVYDEILILDTRGRICSSLARGEAYGRKSADPLLAETLRIERMQAQDKYLETFRGTDLRPGKGETLLYSQTIKDPDTQEALGVLFLCFDFKDEMERIFSDLRQGNDLMRVAVLDEGGRIIAGNDPQTLPLGLTVPVDVEAEFRLLEFEAKPYLVSTVATDGYQGFYGLTWYGMAMIGTAEAFRHGGENGGQSSGSQLRNFSRDLTAIKNESDDLLADMKLDSLNGQVKAAKFKADGFVEVLRFVNWIGDEIDGLFFDAIKNLQQTVVDALFNDVQFRAFQGNNIADRNLYERANDVCWWALTPLFRSLLARHAERGLDAAEREALTGNLQYINNLYTPYLRLLLADADGVVVACSTPPDGLNERFTDQDLPSGQDFVGMKLDPALVHRAMGLSTSKDYCVSAFEPTPLYGGRPTYVYSTAVRAQSAGEPAVGVIQIVFDAEPQFMAMLLDALPRNEMKQIVDGSFGVFADRGKRIVSSTSPDYPVGKRLNLSDRFFHLDNGERESAVVEMDGRAYAMGAQVSSGYREYKRGDGYDNDILCLVFVPI
ncbi:hypothetical protein dsx2_1278 [Desulfovibrio sp. X2]|uniref:cache domain-containing protein n=1 Tax=Desulfovibrio sp. X2 TaxID=941449 RepID=UPI0003586D4C|nr:cache domain-containing protein [Desulfovibrio sp. X2]EPR44650.1 hypothetical protein dsx2_1278 [Desulfovibrio sp. X2]